MVEQELLLLGLLEEGAKHGYEIKQESRRFLFYLQALKKNLSITDYQF